MKELSLQEAALAWAQGKRVEAAVIGGDEWMPIDPIGECLRNAYPPSVFSCRDEYGFRIAPEPPAKKFRPWTPEEVPVGAITRSQVPHEVLMIIGRNEDGVRLADDDGWYSYSALVLARTYSTDGGKTWLPCGVEVDA
jgi:hypothetical protein